MKQKQRLLAQISAISNSRFAHAKLDKDTHNKLSDKQQALVAQINLNSGLQDKKKPQSQCTLPQKKLIFLKLTRPIAF